MAKPRCTSFPGTMLGDLIVPSLLCTLPNPLPLCQPLLPSLMRMGKAFLLPRVTLYLEFQVLPTRASTFLRALSPSTLPYALVPDLPSKILRTLLPFECLSSVSCLPPTAVHLSCRSSRMSLDLGLGLHSLLFPSPSLGGSRPLPRH